MDPQGQIGAAIFIFEPHVIAGNPSLELRDYYSQALLAANRLATEEVQTVLRHLLVRSERRVSAVPGPTIGVDLRIGCCGQRPMSVSPLLGRRSVINRRTQKGVAESNTLAKPR